MFYKNIQNKFRAFLPYLLVLVFLSIWLVIFVNKQINLETADLGRHIKSGELILEDFSVPRTNLFSYTEQDFPFLDHHWGTGVIFYLLYKSFGFPGLSLFYIILSLLTFFILFHLSYRFSNFFVAACCALLIIPLLSERKEIRPEIFSYLFSAIFLWLLFNWRQKKIRSKFLFIIPFVGLFWVNLHIYFIFGLGIIGAFLLEKIWAFIKDREDIQNLKDLKFLSFIFGITFLASFINPFGFSNVLYPFRIFQNYGYRVVENQSVGFLENLGFFHNSNFIIFKILLGLLFLSFLSVFIFNRKKFFLPFFIIAATVSLAGWFSIRNFTLFGYLALPILAFNFRMSFEKKSIDEQKVAKIILLISAIFFSIFCIKNYPLVFSGDNENQGLGLEKESTDGAKFFLKNNIHGPIMNNYDIGGLLIFYLYPQEKVFVDNRPEAYPASFFENIYVPMQEKEDVWKKEDEKYNFNAIFFYLNDATPWGQNFLVNRSKDPRWAMVFADEHSVIFLKRNAENAEVIKNHEIKLK